jgi:hypothetical protein
MKLCPFSIESSKSADQADKHIINLGLSAADLVSLSVLSHALRLRNFC